MVPRQSARWSRLLAVLVLWAGARAYGQTQAKDPRCNPADGAKNPCTAPATPPSAAQQFPFPGESKEEKEPEAPSAAPSSSSPSKPVKDQFPYPGEASAPGDSSSAKGESSSSSSADVPPPDVDGKPALKDEGTEGSTARGRRRLRPPAQKILSDDERVEEDLSVAHFYQQSGNLNGAYLRVKDAVKVEPQAANAHLALAEVAQKLGKRDEAIAEYTKYLELDPDGDGVKAAKKGLERLKP